MSSMMIVYCKSMLTRVWFTLWLWVRPAIKWILRRTTRLCELQRLCYGTLAGAERSIAVEFSLHHSRHPEIVKCYQYLDSKAAEQQQLRPDVIFYAVYAIIRVKEINTKLHHRFSGQLLSCIGSIWGYRQLVSQVEAVRLTKCSNASPPPDGTLLVTDKLLQLWASLMPDTTLQGQISKEWQDIGFQGNDPSTDFRGMGLLGLENLLYFAQTHNTAARHVLSRSHHPQYGYSFAIVGINLTQLAYTLLKDGALKHHFYNIAVKDSHMDAKPGDATTVSMLQMHQFHQVYCYLFFEFDVLWRNEKPKDIMEFSRIRDKFDVLIRKRLQPFDALLKSKHVLENV